MEEKQDSEVSVSEERDRGKRRKDTVLDDDIIMGYKKVAVKKQPKLKQSEVCSR